MTTPHPTQPVPAVLGRLLISLGVLALAGGAFRLSLRMPPAAQGAALAAGAQREPLDGASSLQLHLDGDHPNLTLEAADLPGLALQGQLNGPEELRRTASRAGGALALDYSARVGGAWPFWLGSQDGRWTLTLNRALPSRLDLTLASGDLNLGLEGARLQGLTAQTDSGNLEARLPARLSGDVRLSTASGDLRARVVGPEGGRQAGGQPGGQTFSARSGSGELDLDLSAAAFRRVEAVTASGDLGLTLPARGGLNARLQSGSGDLTATLPAGSGGGTVSVQTGSGDLTLRLDPARAVVVRAQSGSGDLDGPDGPLAGGVYRTPAAAGAPALQVTLQTGSGDVRIEEARP